MPPKPIIVVMVLALCLRLAFWAVGADVVWSDPYIGADTPWYVAGAMNLVDHGVYTSDMAVRSGLFFRPPGYSLFWAPFYALFGEHAAYVAVAAVQIALDVATVALVGLIVWALGRSVWAATIGALIYAGYPFAIVWTTVSLPDAVSNFLTFALVALLLTAGQRPSRWMLAGAVFAVCIFMREYLGLLGIVAPFVAYQVSGSLKQALRYCVFFGVAAVVVYAPWPVRNLVSHGELVVFRVAGSGSRSFQADMRAASAWLSAWSTLPQEYVEEIEDGDSPVVFPRNVFESEAEQQFAHRLALRARKCGGSFNAKARHQPLKEVCTAEVAKGFQTLLDSYREQHPVRYWLEVPMKNLRKALFKSSLVKPKQGAAGYAERLVFLMRSLLLIVGIVGVFVYRRHLPLLGLATSCLSIYLFMAFIFRGLQMRYLLQSDLLMLVPASMVLGALVVRVETRLRTR